MATPAQVKQYLAYWFQLGKKLCQAQGDRLLPQPVLQGDRYSPAFEDCWETVLASGGQGYALEGTEQTIAELLTPAWEIDQCARCSMPVPLVQAGIQPLSCPCSDLPLWPNTSLPQPRSPVSTQTQLSGIRDRLRQSKST